MIKQLLKDIDTLNGKSKFRLSFYASGGFVEFYNTSGKVFVLGLRSIISVLEDIIENLPEFAKSDDYVEKEWRDLGSEYFSDGAANAMATVQTKPLYATLTKFVAIANKNLASYDDSWIDLEKSKLTNTVAYMKKLSSLFEVDENTESNDKNIEEVELKSEFAQWLVDNPRNHYFDDDIAKALKALGVYQEKYEEEFKTKLFEINFAELQKEIETIEQNIWNTESAFFEFSEKTSTHQPRAIFGSRNYLKFLQEYQKPKETAGEVILGYNKIYFGAPGTGKSYAVAQLLKVNKVRESNVERVTFHPDYDYSSFIGGYKPVTETDGQGNEFVKYKFVPQVFVNIYEKAWRNPRQNYYLVIEEINRGNCAEIFGDVFQLLDRNPDYTITPSEDLAKYLNKRDEVSANKSLHQGKLVMPSNLIILATMNTSDQSLYPMDSAFKRRWDWEYVPVKYPIDETDSSCPSFGYKIKLDEHHHINWIDFVKNINAHIMQNPSLGMDKCLGNFFVKPDETGEISIDAVINKVMFYLWNDVFRDEENEVFSDHSYNDYFPIATNGRAQLHALSSKYDLIVESVVVAEPEVIAFTDEEKTT
ncbi:MAG: AAA family ATPase [Pedobacter sp.]|uniref:McrB family protein n=1 Tax=Pedobacter sp. TaxID=1411316 RepID=UPI0028090967|nr:AAA family ATPase [Pedobacter sp.]MDQ8005269.1 AAA family ATPase [Pedobacter sp.]